LSWYQERLPKLPPIILTDKWMADVQV